MYASVIIHASFVDTSLCAIEAEVTIVVVAAIAEIVAIETVDAVATVELLGKVAPCIVGVGDSLAATWVSQGRRVSALWGKG